MMTSGTRPCQFTARGPAAASVAPMTPPISACDELDGMPKSQVMRFQMIAPARPAKTTVSVTRPVLTRPFAIVAATPSERNAPTSGVNLRSDDPRGCVNGSLLLSEEQLTSFHQALTPRHRTLRLRNASLILYVE